MKFLKNSNETFESSIVKAFSAMSMDAEFELIFDQNSSPNFFDINQSIIDNSKISLPNFLENFSEKSLVDCRSIADLSCAYWLFHNKEIHQEKEFFAEEKLIFDEFEKMRVILNIKKFYLGATKNILQKIDYDISYDSNHLSLLMLEEIIPNLLPDKTKRIINDYKKNLDKNLIKQIKTISKHIHNQREFANQVEKLLLEIKQENQDQTKSTKNNQTNKKTDDLSSNQEESDLENNQNLIDQENNGETESKQQDFDMQSFQVEDNSIKTESSKAQSEKNITNKVEFIDEYKIFTNKFDEIIFPQKLVKKEDLELLRYQLELKMKKLQSISKNSSNKLKRQLISQKNIPKENNFSQGILDRKKIVKIVTNPSYEDIYVNNKFLKTQDTVITILIDNSGSMRGNPIVMSALTCEIISKILEKFLIKTEIIGFTTADWRGGKSRKLWEEKGKPKNPGRLNDMRHIIYKSFDKTFKKSAINLGLMLKEGILKENIDGESLIFGYKRLIKQVEERKIMLIISDGTPVDDSTNSTNDCDILSNHLHSVINKIEKKSKIEIIGIGIGHATNQFYQNSITIKNIEDLGDAMIEKICLAISNKNR